MATKRINQGEIAQMLNLSQTTVSRSLANHPAINPETKAMVLEAAAKLGYAQRVQRNQAAHNRHTVIIGVVISMPKGSSGPSETFQLVLKGIADKSSIHDSILDVVYHEPGLAEDAGLARRIRSAKWKGAVLIYPMAPRLAHEIAHQTACVSIVENYRHDLIDSIDVDQSEAFHSLVEKLHAHGHRRIGFLTWVYDIATPWVMHRFGSYVEALYRCGLEFDPATAVNIRVGETLTPKACAARAADLVSQGVTAFVCPADHQAYQLTIDLRERGLRVPEDVSITGFDGANPYPGCPQLATVRVPYEELGRSAIHQLVRRIEQPTAPRRHILVDGDLIDGTSIAAPKS